MHGNPCPLDASPISLRLCETAQVTGDVRAPRASVLMPVHRPDPAFLRLAISSVLHQTVDDWQLVIVDDASDDPRTNEGAP